ncbi:sugar nucleotidyltransferase-like protein [Halococcus morrhuae DSM 1307]|uniref:Sugar nucleotidyltransferase-like protein n=2 Tax=Halococcus morrhuae TaxID=2250 RepID=M0M1T5_HALMO|nr:sugar nucleotidyltransferase-like protein [Halococcus morrhuae DSM 1307]
MGDRTAELPKLFLEVGGRPLYEHQLTRLAPHCDRITVVLGHGFDDGTAPESVFDTSKIAADTDVEFMVIDEWATTENSYTAHSALERIDDEDVLLVCGDVVFTQSVIDELVQTYENGLRDDGFSGVGVVEGVQDEMTAVRWDDEDVITDYGAIKGHQEVGLFVLNAAHRDQAMEILGGQDNDWFPIVFENVPSKPIRVDENERHEINTPAHLRAAQDKWSARAEHSIPER